MGLRATCFRPACLLLALGVGGATGAAADETGLLARVRQGIAGLGGGEAGPPACAPEQHDEHAWHPLLDEDAGCHYDHEHKDDPDAVSGVLGPLGAFANRAGMVLPWTESLADPAGSHAGWGFLVRRDQPCESRFADGCLTDFRVGVHAVLAAPGAAQRFHPFSLEARACREGAPERCGLIRTGGWADYGHLEVDGRHVPLPGDPERLGRAGRRIHHLESGDPNVGTWLGRNAMATLALQTSRMWGLVFPDRPFQLHLFCPQGGCKSNASTLQAHVVGFRVPDHLDEDRDGIVSYLGYTDRHGELVEGCTEVGVDCVPLEILDMPVGAYEYRDDTHGLDTGLDYDPSPGRSWIRFLH